MHSLFRASAYASISAFLLLPALAVAPAPAAADAMTDAFKGKTMTMYVGSAPGGGYDRYTRLIERHFNRHVPGTPKTDAGPRARESRAVEHPSRHPRPAPRAAPADARWPASGQSLVEPSFCSPRLSSNKNMTR